MISKTLDEKLSRILADSSCSDFILADAKDADMAFGIAAPSRNPGENRWRSLREYREIIRQNVEQVIVLAFIRVRARSVTCSSCTFKSNEK